MLTIKPSMIYRNIARFNDFRKLLNLTFKDSICYETGTIFKYDPKGTKIIPFKAVDLVELSEEENAQTRYFGLTYNEALSILKSI